MRALTFALFSLVFPLAQAAEDLTVEARRRDDALEVACSATLAAPAELVWQTLTDYNRLAEFIPGLRRSRVVGQKDGMLVVEQSGEASFLFVSIPIEVTLLTRERPPHAIEVTLDKGTLRRLEGAYRIEPRADGRVLLTWRGLVEAHSLPPLLGEMLMRASIEDQFRGMVREIERREALRRAAPAVEAR